MSGFGKSNGFEKCLSKENKNCQALFFWVSGVIQIKYFLVDYLTERIFTMQFHDTGQKQQIAEITLVPFVPTLSTFH